MNTKPTEQDKPAHMMTFYEKVAACTGVSEDYAYRILSGVRVAETPKGESVRVAAVLIEEKENLLLREVKRIVKF